MCVVSNVHDYGERTIPWVEPIEPFTPYVPTRTAPGTGGWPLAPTIDFGKLREMLDEFKALIEAAKFIDAKMGTPDCLDPEKAKLQERVAQLEQMLNEKPEFVLVKGGMFEPGTYRVIEGKPYRVVDDAPPKAKAKRVQKRKRK